MPRIKKPKIEDEKIEQLIGREIEQPKKLIGAKLIVGLMLFAVIGGSLCFGGYFYFQYKKVLANPSSGTQSEIKTLTDKIGKFVDLPTDEEPSIAEVKDTEKLKGQLFFSGAQNGDKVMIYSKNKKAVLYRPGTGKVIEVTSLGLKAENEQAAAIQAAPAETVAQVVPVEVPVETKAETSAPVVAGATQPVKVIVYNGTKIKGLAGKLADQISASVAGTEIAKTGNSVGNYARTIVVDLSGSNSELVQKIVSTIGGEVGKLPSDEEKPEGDILVIGGGE
jgi:hypothetical protein